LGVGGTELVDGNEKKIWSSGEERRREAKSLERRGQNKKKGFQSYRINSNPTNFKDKKYKAASQ
jgi:hypothetical protein